MLGISHLFQKRFSLVYHFGKRTYKIFTPNGIAFRVAEIQGNRSALKSEFWKNRVLEVTPACFYLEMKRGEPVLLRSPQKAEQFIESRLEAALSYPLSPAHQGFDFSYLRGMERYGLDAGLLPKAEKILKSLFLPLTSAHGDLHIGNMICIDQEIKIIDWSMFSRKGSFVTDYIHFYNYRSAESNRESWTQAILREQQVLEDLSQLFKTTPQHLRLAYAISRISGAVKQRKDFHQIPQKEIAKYNLVLNHIIDEPKAALV